MDKEQSTFEQQHPLPPDDASPALSPDPQRRLRRRSSIEGPVEVVAEPPPALPAAQEPSLPPVIATWTELRGVWRVFAGVEWVLRDRRSFFAEVRERRALGTKLRDMIVSSAILFSLYGLVMGLSNSWQQALTAAVKLPSLFLITLFVCLPTLYFFNLLFGAQLTLRQTATLIMTSINVTAALSLAFASITLTIWLTVPDYGFYVLLNVGVLAMMSWWGLGFLIQGIRFVQQGYMGVQRRRVLLFWVIIYGFVGTQMAWALRPFVGAPGQPFEVLREADGTFYSGVYHLLRRLLGF